MIRRLSLAAVYAVLLLVTVFTIGPFLWMIGGSFMTAMCFEVTQATHGASGYYSALDRRLHALLSVPTGAGKLIAG